MPTYIEWGSFGAAAAAVAVAFYAVWEGYRNQLRAGDREQRREHYAKFSVAVDNLIDDFETLDKQLKPYRGPLMAAVASGLETPPKGASVPPNFATVLARLELWIDAALDGMSIDDSRLMDELTKLGMPADDRYQIEFLAAVIRSIATHGHLVHLSGKVLSLSGTPARVRDAVNSFAKSLEKELKKIATVSPEPGNWERLRKRYDGIEKLMKDDIGSLK